MEDLYAPKSHLLLRRRGEKVFTHRLVWRHLVDNQYVLATPDRRGQMETLSCPPFEQIEQWNTWPGKCPAEVRRPNCYMDEGAPQGRFKWPAIKRRNQEAVVLQFDGVNLQAQALPLGDAGYGSDGGPLGPRLRLNGKQPAAAA